MPGKAVLQALLFFFLVYSIMAGVLNSTHFNAAVTKDPVELILSGAESTAISPQTEELEADLDSNKLKANESAEVMGNGTELADSCEVGNDSFEELNEARNITVIFPSNSDYSEAKNCSKMKIKKKKLEELKKLEDFLDEVTNENETKTENQTTVIDQVNKLGGRSSSNETSTEFRFENSTAAVDCVTFEDCAVGCVCTSFAKCECSDSFPVFTTPFGKKKPLYESLTGYNRIRLYRPSEYNNRNNLKYSELAQLSGSKSASSRLITSPYLTRVGSGKLIGLPRNQLYAKRFRSSI